MLQRLMVGCGCGGIGAEAVRMAFRRLFLVDIVSRSFMKASEILHDPISCYSGTIEVKTYAIFF